MTNKDEILNSISFIWRQKPLENLRLGQLLCTCANYNTLYYISDNELIKLLKQHYKLDLEIWGELTEDTDEENNKVVFVHNSNSGVVKRIPKYCLQDYLDAGWERGRK